MFRYKIYYFDKLNSKSRTENGIVAAATYGDAADKLIEFYGKDNVYTLGLCELEDILVEDDIIEEFETPLSL